MPSGHRLAVTLTTHELRRLERAARTTAMTPEIFARNAILNAIHHVTVTPKRYKPHELTQIYRRAEAKNHTWTEEELRQRNLPLYWSKAWVQAQLDQGYTAAQIALNAGGYQKMAVSRHISLKHGLGTRAMLTPEQQDQIRTRAEQGATRLQLMQEFNISEFTASKYAQLVNADEELLLRFRQEAQRVTWPATRPMIAEALFGGSKTRADNWVAERHKRGWLTRVKTGLYDLSLPSDAPTADRKCQ